MYESYQKVEEVILWQLERYGIDALLLMGTDVGEMYLKPEMSRVGRIEFLADKKDFPLINRFMLEMDYERKEDLAANGMAYVRVPGVRIVFYDEIPIENKVIKKYFSGSVKRYRRMESYKHIHMLANEEAYLYRIAKMVELYITGKLKIRDIMDLWQYKKLLGEQFRWKIVREYLEKAVWMEFVRQTELLATLWFGEDVEEQYGLAVELEEYIISRGRENKHLDEALLPCEKIRLDFYWRNRDKEWSLKKQAWLFPSREYMVQFFPILEKYPFLLAFCWIIRNFRFLKRICMSKCKRMKFRIRIRLSDMKEKLKGMMNRDNQEKTPEQLPGDGSGEIAGDSSGEIPQTVEQKAKSDENGSMDDAANLDETEGEKKVEEFEDQS